MSTERRKEVLTFSFRLKLVLHPDGINVWREARQVGTWTPQFGLELNEEQPASYRRRITSACINLWEQRKQ